MRFLVTYLWLASSSSALAGWHSGGGDLVTEATNPWWLANTTTVDYCIEIDAAHFGQSLEVSRDKISAALAYWRRQFSESPAEHGLKRTNGVATQVFHEAVACGEGIDLRFQLGTLTKEQADYLEQPKKVVAVEVQTSYDKLNLHGKGFIYVSPERGDLALDGLSLASNYVGLNRWERAGGKGLELVLIHELGHVFGLPHIPGNGVMDAMLPAQVAQDVDECSSYANQLSDKTVIPDLVLFDNPLLDRTFATDFTVSNGYWNDFFHDSIARIEVRPKDPDHAELYGQVFGSDPHLLGTLTYKGRADYEWSPFVFTYFTSEWAGSVDPDRKDAMVVPIYQRHRYIRSATFQAASGGSPRPMLLEFSDGFLTIDGVDASGAVQWGFIRASQWIAPFAQVSCRDGLPH